MKRKMIVSAVCALLAVAMIAGGLLLRSVDKTAYEQLRKDGYLGTEEQLLASLVGELSGGASAYDLACGLNYQKNIENWARTLTGRASKTPEIAVFEQIRGHGYEGSFAAWLESLVPEPEQLGCSDEDEATEYELACQYGFEGSFAQWLISLVGYEEK